MKNYPAADIRNVVLVGHNDTGKTTLVSQLLFNAGAITRLGSIGDGTTVTDFDPDEIERQHSISTALAHAEWKNHKINIIDTPGFGIFLMEAKSGMRVADAAIVVVSGVTGVEVSTERVWKFANEFSLPRMVVVNKLDRERSSFNRALDSLQRKFSKAITPIQIPMGEEKDFCGVIDLVSMKAFKYKLDASGEFEEIDIPDEYQADADTWHETLVEKVAEGDDTLMEKFFEEGSLPKADLVDGLQREILSGDIVPLTVCSASRNIGGDVILDTIVELMPAADSHGKVWGKTPGDDGEEIEFDTTEHAFPSALVFKTMSDPFSGQVTIFRVFSGQINSDTTYWNATRDHEERVGKLQSVLGKQFEHVPVLGPGDIGAVAKLKDTHTGDTICAKDHQIVIPHIAYPESSISFAIEPKSKGDEDKLSTGIARVIEEDPTISFGREEQTHELLISGQGQLHVEIVIAKLSRKYGVEVILHPPKVPYRETIMRAADAHGRHKKQSGGHGQFADCKIKIEPLERGEDFEFVVEIFGGSIPRQFIPAVEKGIQEARRKGFLAGYPVVDFRVRLKDGQFHAVDSSELAFKIAASLAFHDGMEKGRATILEPIMHVDLYAPSEYMGDLMGDLTSRRGKVEGMESDDENQVIKAHVPMSEMLTYGSVLRSITQGRGSFHMEFSHYEEVPRSLQQKIIDESKQAKEEHAHD